jgi:hypothetical protein
MLVCDSEQFITKEKELNMDIIIYKIFIGMPLQYYN